jgi:hypothetical protein
MLRKLTYDAKRFIKYNYQFLDKNMRKKFMNNKVIAYIDQQSYHGLERYDVNLLTSIKKIKPMKKILRNIYA